MANKKRAVNQAARKAASDGNITEKEVKKIQRIAADSGAKNTVEAIARAAADNRAQIAEASARALGISQNKDLSRSSVTRTLQNSYMNAGTGSDFYVSGFSNRQRSGPNQGSWTEKNPIYTYKGNPAGAGGGSNGGDGAGGGASGPSGPAMDPMTNAWSASIDQAMARMNKQIKAQIQAQTEQTELYMGMMKDMMEQMQNAGQSVQQPAYTVTTTQTPATGAQTTEEITARKPVTNDTLTIDPVATAAGTGLNLAI